MELVTSQNGGTHARWSYQGSQVLFLSGTAKKRFPESGSRISTYYDYLCYQEHYFVEENYEIFNTLISTREKLRQNNAGSLQGVLLPLVISSTIGHFEFVRRLESY